MATANIILDTRRVDKNGNYSLSLEQKDSTDFFILSSI